MEDLSPDEAGDCECSRWLNFELRCFGDKGDVEDITEGPPNPPYLYPTHYMSY